jgi:hypothetical protein
MVCCARPALIAGWQIDLPVGWLNYRRVLPIRYRIWYFAK